MNESITKEQARERLESARYMGAAVDQTIDILFPPPFVPKEGEVIAVKSEWSSGWLFRKFIEIVDSRYSCTSDGEGNSVIEWDIARPQTDKERRV